MREWELPDGWRLVARPHPASAALDRDLEIARNNELADIQSWVELEEAATGKRVLLRLVQQVRNHGLVAGGIYASGVILLPAAAEDRITSGDLRIPLRTIEDGAIKQLLPGLAQLRSAPGVTEYVPPAPVGRPDGTDGFYGRVAQLWMFLRDEDAYPTKRIAEINSVSLQTAQRWVTTARRAGWLPAGIRGRAK